MAGKLFSALGTRFLAFSETFQPSARKGEIYRPPFMRPFAPCFGGRGQLSGQSCRIDFGSWEGTHQNEAKHMGVPAETGRTGATAMKFNLLLSLCVVTAFALSCTRAHATPEETF